MGNNSKTTAATDGVFTKNAGRILSNFLLTLQPQTSEDKYAYVTALARLTT